ncbi:MAG: BLUF domain-containing protein [Rhodospirillum sp.]|nr:BLUF domain-containing protein [Rhodospirillum sp.]MCF8488658.1 BLUF domain-containing protein [Rhodospirillum sp.]MCF8501737.1 BLUF domain-containing protein [Rhodospirillum sp.]
MPTLIQLAYVSQTTSDLSEDAALNIATRSTRKNNLLKIGGFLYLQNRSIFQVLEGEADVVRTLFARIMTDPRHHTVTQVRDRPIGGRQFIRWGMTRLSACPRILSRDLACDRADPKRCLANRCHEKEGFVDKIIATGALIHDMSVVPGKEVSFPPPSPPVPDKVRCQASNWEKKSSTVPSSTSWT